MRDIDLLSRFVDALRLINITGGRLFHTEKKKLAILGGIQVGGSYLARAIII